MAFMVLKGLYMRSWYMGLDALQGNGITRKILYFFRDKALTPADEPLRRVRKSRILLFVTVQLVGFGATMAITQTIGAWSFVLVPPAGYSFAMYSGDRVPYHHLPPRADEDVDRSPAAVHRGRACNLGWTHSVAICK